jgi:hypothetical protein
MSNVIQFLESMGKNAAQGDMSPEEYTAAVKALGVDDIAQHALLNRDHSALNDFLGGRMKMMMMLVPAEDEEGEGKDKGNDDGQKKDEEEISVN